jgi:4-amino-4-deoxy-L-arabinose transferase-like glycosyltransferase
MKTGFLYALVVLIGTIVLLFLLSFVIEALWPVRFSPQRLPEIIGRIAWFFAFVAFVVGWIRQANRKKFKPAAVPPPAKPEHLDPIDYSKLSHIFDETDRKT